MYVIQIRTDAEGRYRFLPEATHRVYYKAAFYIRSDCTVYYVHIQQYYVHFTNVSYIGVFFF